MAAAHDEERQPLSPRVRQRNMASDPSDHWNDNSDVPKMASLDIESPLPGSSSSAKRESSMNQEEGESLSSAPPSANCCVRTWYYGGVAEAKGYALLAIGRGAAVMSNVVVNAALLELASAAAGCPTGEELREMEEAGLIEDANDYECTGTVYGQNPVSLISNIAVATGLLNASLMPIIGVILDFTHYRRFVGILFSLIFGMIQASQIAIGPKTWFPMAILQSIAGFCFTILILTLLAYLPEICERVGQEKHTRYTARFTMKQFSGQASFLVLVGVLSFAFGIAGNSTQTARLSQALNVAVISVLFSVGWRYMPSRQATRELPEGTRGCCGIFAHGLRQNVRTAVSIHRDYKKGLRWYMIATVFAQSSVGSLSTVSVVYLSSVVGLNATDISLFFLVVLIGTVPGTKVAQIVSKRTNPCTSWQLSQICLFTALVIGAFTLGNAPHKYLSLIWGFFIGLILGWFYPTENLFFSCILPKGSEAEITGFRVYCSMILAWLPPLIFSVLVEQGVDAKWGMTFMGSFMLLAASLLRLGAGTWVEILEESGRSDLVVTERDGSQG